MNQHLKIIGGRDPRRDGRITYLPVRAETPVLEGFVDSYPRATLPDDSTTLIVAVHCLSMEPSRVGVLMRRRGFIHKGMMFEVEISAFDLGDPDHDDAPD